MYMVYKDGMSIIMKKIGMVCGGILIILLLSALTWGTDVIALLDGPRPMDTVETSLVDGKENHEELEHAYVRVTIDMITGSYAQYGEVKEEEMNNQTVYYLMPVNNGSYFITVIAHGDAITSLDKMEKAFYNSIGKEEKEYPETIHVEGGIKKLTEEELTYALDYFSTYDQTIQTKDQLPQIMSPYAIVLEEIGSTSIQSLWFLLTIWIILSVICIIGFILYMTKFFMRTLQKDINALSEEHRESLDDDYKKATSIGSLKIGNHLLYKKQSWSWRVWEYDSFIWIYKKEILGKKQRQFEVCIFDQEGTKYTIWTGNDEKRAQKVLQKVFDHCPNALLGYESYIYEYWKEQPKKLYEKLKELELIKQKEKVYKKQEKKAKKKSSKKDLKIKRDEQKYEAASHINEKKVKQTNEKTKKKDEHKKKNENFDQVYEDKEKDHI